MGKEGSEGDRGEDDSSEEGSAVAVVKVMAGFEVFSMARIEKTGVHQTISGVKHPDGYGHGEDRRSWESDVVGAGDEPRPESGYRGSVEREKMPES